MGGRSESTALAVGELRDVFFVSAVANDVVSAASRSRLVAITVDRMSLSDRFCNSWLDIV